MMDKLFLTVLNMSLTGAFVIVFICIARLLLKKMPKIISYSLWSVAGFRLVFPFSIESFYSLIPFKAQAIPLDIATQPIPRINSGITYLNNAVSSVLPVSTPTESVSSMQIWVTVGMYIWAIGFAAMLIYGVLSYFALKQKMIRAIHTEKNIYEADNIQTPFVLGIIMPKIYLPIGLSQKERAYIVLHEQTHIQRCDHIIKLVAYLILCIHWFNPIVWLAFLHMGDDMEMSCDERVLREIGSETKRDYSLSLLSLATDRRFIGGSPLAFGEGGVKERINNVLSFKKKPIIIIIAVTVLVAALGLGFATNRAKELELPTADNVLYISLNQNNGFEPAAEVVISDKQTIGDIINALSGAKKIFRQSVNDAPSVDDYLTVRLHQKDQATTLFLYNDVEDYIEQPYVGIYRTKKPFTYVSIFTQNQSENDIGNIFSFVKNVYSFYSAFGNGNAKVTYILENMTEKQMLERFKSITLYGDKTAVLETPPISSYLLPECTYEFKEDKLLIYTKIEADQAEYENKPIAVFTVLNDNTLVFNSSTIPLFADGGARYVLAPSENDSTITD